jgi:hypothetical protein
MLLYRLDELWLENDCAEADAEVEAAEASEGLRYCCASVAWWSDGLGPGQPTWLCGSCMVMGGQHISGSTEVGRENTVCKRGSTAVFFFSRPDPQSVGLVEPLGRDLGAFWLSSVCPFLPFQVMLVPRPFVACVLPEGLQPGLFHTYTHVCLSAVQPGPGWRLLVLVLCCC